jgi:hypothetical protein
MRIEEKGCQASCAMGAIEPTSEYWLPLRPVSFCRPKIEPYPRTDLSRICGGGRVSLYQSGGMEILVLCVNSPAGSRPR